MQLGSLYNGPAVAIPQAPVGYNRVIMVCLQLLDGVVSRSGRGDRVPGSFQNRTLQRNYVRFVIDTEDACHRFGSPQGSPAPRMGGTNIALPVSRLSIDMPLFPSTNSDMLFTCWIEKKIHLSTLICRRRKKPEAFSSGLAPAETYSSFLPMDFPCVNNSK